MLFRALGATSVEPDQGVVALVGTRARRLLAALLLHAPDPVAVDELVDQVWPAAPPRTAPKTLQTYVGSLRRQLGAERVITYPTAYAVVVGPDEYDVALFEAAVQSGRAAMREERWEEACTSLQTAMALWRGEPFADLAFTPPIARQLVELRGYAVVDLAAAELSAGRVRESVSRLRAELVASPLREELWALLMRALHRDGRTSEALAAFDEARRVLRDELGTDPGPELRAMHAALLEDEPARLDPGSGDPAAAQRERLQYARSDGGMVSYQVLGAGEQVLLVVPDWFNTIIGLQRHPAPRRLLERLATGRRVVLFDTLGMGRSDPLPRVSQPSIDRWVRDAVAVLDSAGVQRCAVLGSSVGAAVAVLLAVRHPALVQKLVLHNPVVRTRDTMIALVGYDEVLRLFNDKWATGTAIPSVAASRVNDADFNAWFGRFMASSVSAERLPALLDRLVFSLDVMADVPATGCPVLLTVRAENPILGPAALDGLRAALPHAAMRTLAGGDHLWFIDDEGDLAAAVDEFLSAYAPSS